MTPADLAMCAFHLARITKAPEAHAAAAMLMADARPSRPRPFLIVDNSRRGRP